jgi:hypothetical protein
LENTWGEEEVDKLDHPWNLTQEQKDEYLAINQKRRRTNCADPTPGYDICYFGTIRGTSKP